MNNTGISSGEELKKAVKEIIEIASGAIKSTLGPSGTNVGVRTPIYTPIIVNDGVTVAKALKGLYSEDSLKNYIIDIVISACSNTEEMAGDGTTTTATLLEAIILEGYRIIEADQSAVEVVNGIKLATEDILEALEGKTTLIGKKDKLLQKIAVISSNNDKELGEVIFKMFSQIGANGQIETKDSNSLETTVEVIDGMQYDSGMEHQTFSNMAKTEALLENCNILLYEGKLKNIDPIFDILNTVRGKDESILVIADDFSPQAIESMASNKMQAKLKICAVRSPGFGEKKENDVSDIAFMTGATVVSPKNGQELDNDVLMDQLGFVGSAKITGNSFTLFCEHEDRKESIKRVDELKDKLSSARGTEKSELLERIARLSDGIGVIYVGGSSPEEIAEKKFRIEDAVNATRVALEEGIVPGGGVTLLRLADEAELLGVRTQAERFGYNLLLKALEAPIRTICANSGVKSDLVIDRILNRKSFNFGYNAKTEKYGDLIKDGVVDPKKVTRAALQNASSIARLVLSTNYIIH